MILTSNKSYGSWGEVFENNVVATAILDRLLHYSTTINIKGDSYRIRENKKDGFYDTGKFDENPSIKRGFFDRFFYYNPFISAHNFIVQLIVAYPVLQHTSHFRLPYSPQHSWRINIFI
ncbi:ATP-binding protein [Acetobacterium sp. KB-1]|uniref:ATP-binding protein n=1 Tax=unclassified Acetobacterium TaxID=2638182 RepID=UPI00352A3D28